MAENTTLISISKETWYKLNKMKDYADSFDDVINKLINIYKNHIPG